MRKSVRSLLHGNSLVDVCGEASDGEEAVKKVGELHPDIVLLDIEMPRMNGIQAARQIHLLQPSTKIVFFTAHPQSVFDESTMWSDGFVSKFSAETQLLPTLDRLIHNVPEGLNGPPKYQWQNSVMDALASDCQSLDVKIAIAERAIAIRLTDVKLPNREERTALNDALRALHRVVQHKTPDER
jgi:DNA-binding NarL/FixJ family response regulator